MKFGSYNLDILVTGYPGKSVCHGSLGWSTIALLRGEGRVALIDVGSFNQRTLIQKQLDAHDLAPADVLKNDFEALENSIGGMTRLTGSRIENNVTVGWDAFAQDGAVRFVREAIDYGDAGTASFRYAYKDGKPWVIAREQGGTVTLVGWSADGSLLLNRVGENNGGTSEAEVAKLRKMAEDAYGQAAAKL